MVPDALMQDIRSALGNGLSLHNRTDDIAPQAGTYVLILHLPHVLMLGQRWEDRKLAPGWHLYCGSARGPGGLKARLTRHMRRDKTLRWHIDALTIQADYIAALPFSEREGFSECALAARLAAHEAFTMPLPGFGSSDCRTCRSHLLRWHPRTDVAMTT